MFCHLKLCIGIISIAILYRGVKYTHLKIPIDYYRNTNGRGQLQTSSNGIIVGCIVDVNSFSP